MRVGVSGRSEYLADPCLAGAACFLFEVADLGSDESFVLSYQVECRVMLVGADGWKDATDPIVVDAAVDPVQ